MNLLHFRADRILLGFCLALGVGATACTTTADGLIPKVDGGFGSAGAAGQPNIGGRAGTSSGGNTGMGGSVGLGGAGGGTFNPDAAAGSRDALGPLLDAPAGPEVARDAGRCLTAPGARRTIGLTCGCNEECGSGFCVDGVCCNLACSGACVSCNQLSKMGECTPVAARVADPHGICKREAPETCGQSGMCNGLGGCSKHMIGTMCRPSICSGGSLVPASSCDGNGTCLAGSPLNCSPSICSNAACKLACASNADCAAPNTCVNGSCGLRGPGQMCTGGAQCRSGFCTDGVCCDSACAGKCSFCAFPNSPGRCVAVPADRPDPRAAAGVTDPLRICPDQGPASCGSNGRCDGAGGCQRYATGTVCKAELCDATSNLWTAEAVCRNGACVAPTPRNCAPFKCGANRCAGSCVGNTDCVSPNVCLMSSCGKKPIGSLCAGGGECGSGFCAEGVCCSSACTGSCYSCNLAGSAGTCTTVSNGGVDPLGKCKDDGTTSCGNDGTCDGAGQCRKYGPMTICSPQKCVMGLKTSAATCDGTGKCIAGTDVTCAPYVCTADGTNCFSSCTGTGDSPQCAMPNKCNNQRCGPSAKGQDCGVTSDCAAALFCVSGVCCNTSACAGCKSCTLSASLGTCTNLGTTATSLTCPAHTITNACGNTGFCNGNGGCAREPNTVQCMAAACTTVTDGTNAAKCNGSGACQTAVGFSCGANSRCVGGDCPPCTKDSDCLNNKACVFDAMTGVGRCGGASANGVSCSTGGNTSCQSGFCVDSVCCERVCGECERCDSQGPTAGKCVPVANGVKDDSCVDSVSTACGKTEFCQGGKCQLTPASTSCGTKCSVDGLGYHALVCDGLGACAALTAVNPCPFVCLPAANASPGSCASTCVKATNANCPSGKVCVGGAPNSPDGDACVTCEAGTNKGCLGVQVCENNICVTKTPGGGPCTVQNNNCISTAPSCVDGVCCQMQNCGSCQKCGGSDGSCQAVKSAGAGTFVPDPDTCADDTASTPCGHLGCDNNGTCQFVVASTMCGAPACTSGMASTRTCDGTGTCNTNTTACAPYKCGAGTTCPTTCATASDCVAGHYCDGATNTCKMNCTNTSQCASGFYCSIPGGQATGACVAKQALGVTCTAAEQCSVNFCVDGICCMSACGGSCKQCMGMGVCSDVTSGADAMCPTETPGMPCGRTGMCSLAGGGACQYVASGTQVSLACAMDNITLVDTKCDGAGATNVTNTSCAATGQVCTGSMCVMGSGGAGGSGGGGAGGAGGAGDDAGTDSGTDVGT